MPKELKQTYEQQVLTAIQKSFGSFDEMGEEPSITWFETYNLLGWEFLSTYQGDSSLVIAAAKELLDEEEELNDGYVAKNHHSAKGKRGVPKFRKHKALPEEIEKTYKDRKSVV